MINEAMLHALARSDPRVFAETIRQYGLEIIGIKDTDPLRKQVQPESVSAVASAMAEAVNDSIEMTTDAIIAKRIAEEYGYIVKILEATAPPLTKPMPKPGIKPGTAPERPERKPRREPWNPPRPAKEPEPKARRRGPDAI